MSKRLPTPIKDGFIGAAIGSAIIVPGLSGGTIALIFGAFKKIVETVDDLFSKNFWRNILTLLPFLLGAIVSVGALIIPFQLAFKYCMFAIVCLFVGFIIGSIPGIADDVKGKPVKKSYIFGIIIAIIFSALIGVLSVIFDYNHVIVALFTDRPFYLYFIIFAVGVIGSTGLIIPGFSGSLLLLVLGFYEPILNLISLEHFWENVALIFTFAVGVLAGFILLSKFIKRLLAIHETGPIYIVIGFIIGSVVSIIVNSKMIGYISESFSLLDKVLGPILFVVGLAISYLFVRYSRKVKSNNAKN